MASSTKRGAWILGGCMTVAILLASAWMVSQFKDGLHSPHFLTGWVAALVLGISALGWWSPPLDLGERARLQRRVRLNLWVAALLLFTFLVHTEFRMPLGWIERALTLGFVGLLVSSCVGALIAAGTTGDRILILRWLRVQVAIHWSLLGLALFHGVFTHTHGLMAHYLFPSTG